MTGEQYWRLRTLAKAVEAEQLRAELAVRIARDRLNDALRAAGLDPATPYRFDDDVADLIEATPPHPPVVG